MEDKGKENLEIKEVESIGSEEKRNRY